MARASSGDVRFHASEPSHQPGSNEEVSAPSADRSPSRDDEPEHGKHCDRHEIRDRRDIC
jgi:hypothetical protein